MVTANELRIDNWVIFNDNTDRYGQILELHKYYAPLKCGYIPDHGENLVIGTTVDYEHLFPIPLTPEILTECCGFHKDNYGIFELVRGNKKYKSGCKILLWTKKAEDKWIFYMGDDLSNLIEVSSIKYLHQLQNLYFALTNKELEVSFP